MKQVHILYILYALWVTEMMNRHMVLVEAITSNQMRFSKNIEVFKTFEEPFSALHSFLLLRSFCFSSVLFSPTSDKLPRTKVVLERDKTL